MKALIFGAAGQLGRALVAAAPAGSDLVALDRAACDVRDAAAIEAGIRAAAPTLVINATGYTAVDKAESEPDAAALLNAAVPGRMAAAARAAGARFLHVSTDFVFDGLASLPYRPDDATNPLSVYGRTKRDGELAALQADPDALVVRTAWVYSAGTGNFMTNMIRLMRERGRVGVVADQIGTPTYARSLAAAIWALAAARAWGIHHYTDAGIAGWYDFAAAIAEEAQAAGILIAAPCVLPIATAEFPTPARRPPFSVLDKGVTWKLLGAPPPHWRVNLRACVQELARNG